MKTLVIAAAALIAGAVTLTPAVVAQPGPRPNRPCVIPPAPPLPPHTNIFNYNKRNHRVCQQKAWQLHSYERCAASDGRLSPREQRIIVELKRDLDRTCGGWRWRG